MGVAEEPMEVQEETVDNKKLREPIKI